MEPSLTEKKKTIWICLVKMEWDPWMIALLLCAVCVVSVFLWKCLAPSRTSLEGEVALVTGGGSGLGKSIAVRLARLGAKVVVWDVNTEAITALVEGAKSGRLNITANVVDVSNPTEIREAAALLDDVTILVNNAGVVSVGTLEKLTDRQIERTFQINTLAHFHTARAFVPKMKATNHGHVVTVASLLGYMGMPHLADYTASKAAAIIFHEALAMELRSFKGIGTTLVCPGTLNTTMFKGVNASFPPVLDADYVADRTVSSVLAFIGHRVLKLPLLFITTPIYTALPMFLKMLGVDILVGDSALASVKGTNPPSDRPKSD